MALQTYCTNCGADLTADADFCGGCGARVPGTGALPAASVTARPPRYKTVGLNTVAVPAPVFYASVAITVVLGLFLLVLLLYGGLGHALNEAQHGSSIAFHNTTDSLLCYGSPSCSAEIKPRATSYWAMDCYSVRADEVTVHTPQGRELYRKFADCDEWQDAIVVINERDGEFIVADSINARAERPPVPD